MDFTHISDESTHFCFELSVFWAWTLGIVVQVTQTSASDCKEEIVWTTTSFWDYHVFMSNVWHCIQYYRCIAKGSVSVVLGQNWTCYPFIGCFSLHMLWALSFMLLCLVQNGCFLSFPFWSFVWIHFVFVNLNCSHCKNLPVFLFNIYTPHPTPIP